MSLALKANFSETYASESQYDLTFLIRASNTSAATGGGLYSQLPVPTPDYFTEYESYDIAGWDGDSAEPIDGATIEAARMLNSLLPPRVAVPDIAPGASGSIGFEWRGDLAGDTSYLLVEIGPGTCVTIRNINKSGKPDTMRFPTIISAWGTLTNLFTHPTSVG